MQDPKSRLKSPSGHHPTTLSGYIFATIRQVSTIGKNLLSSNISPTCPHNMVNFGPLAAEIVSLVWGTPGNFNGFRVSAALLHGTLAVGVSQTTALNRLTEGATYIRQGGHHVGNWPTFIVSFRPPSTVSKLQLATIAVVFKYIWGVKSRYFRPNSCLSRD